MESLLQMERYEQTSRRDTRLKWKRISHPQNNFSYLCENVKQSII